MSQNPQLKRYKKLLSYIEDHFQEEINIEKVEEVCHYSYRNINRIFEAIHNETIGKHIKRLRLEKAAQYLKYSSMGVAEIGYEVGFEDRAAFSKAFKNKYACSPSAYRQMSEAGRIKLQQTLHPGKDREGSTLQFDIAYLPDFEYLGLEYRGDLSNVSDMEETWAALIDYASKEGRVSDRSIFMMEIIDDEEISDRIHSRYNHALILEDPFGVEPDGFFTIKAHQRQKYARFTHKGSYDDSIDFYRLIFAFWMRDVQLELADKPILEFYPNFEEGLPPSELITEIFIAVE